tara:strand:+ start:696 stop:3029 length:2334 start_codon:yes stop_codon:yes gene_type:complete
MANITEDIFRELSDAVRDGIIPEQSLAGIAKKDDATLTEILSTIKQIRELKTQPKTDNPNTALANDEGGIFKYDLDYKGQPSGTLSKSTKQTPEDIQRAYSEKFGTPKDSLQNIGVSERLADDPIAMTNYIMDKGMNDGMSREQVAQKIAGFPRQARAEILEKGVIPRFISGVADQFGGMGNAIYGMFSKDPLTQMGSVEPQADSFGGKLLEGVVTSPITPISLGAGSFLNAGTKLGLAGQSALLGGAEGLAEEGIRHASGVSSGGLGDYTSSGGFGLLGGASAPYAEDLVKKGVGLGLQGLKKGVQGTATLIGGEKLGYGVKEALSKGSETTGDISAIQTAKELGINTEDLPMSITHGTNSANARAERTLGQDSDGQKYIDKYDNAFNVVDNKINETSGVLNAQTPEEAGAILTNGLQASRNNLFSKNTDTFNSVLDDVDLNNNVNDMLASEYAPQLQEKLFYEIDNIDKLLSGSIEKTQISSLKEQKELLTRLTDKLEVADEGGNTYEILNNVRTSLGAIAYDPKLGQFELPSSYIKTLRDTERDVSSTLTDAITGADELRGESLKSTNKAISEHFKNEKEIGKLLGNDKGAEKAFTSIFNDSKRTKEIKQILEANGEGKAFEKARDSWVRKNIILQNADGETLYKSSLKKLRDKKDILKSMYGDDYEAFADQQKKLLNFGSQLGARFHQGSAGANEISMQGMITTPIKKKLAQTRLGSQRYEDVARAKGLNALATSHFNLPIRGVVHGSEQQGIFSDWYNQENTNLGLSGLGNK